jgi:RimJ/RimL family protein N-acetyltransferase
MNKKNTEIIFRPMEINDLQLWEKWIKKSHVANVWFIEGYEPTDYIYTKIAGNGYDYPFIVYVDNLPIGYIQCSDLYTYRTQCQNPKGIFTKEELGTYCMDLFIGEEDYLNKGYGTLIVKAFINYVFTNFLAKKILIDPAISNKRAIHCYEKAGFGFLKQEFDGVNECWVMEISKKKL